MSINAASSLLYQVLVIGGGIANFTDVAETFKGIVKAIRHFQERLRMHKIRIYVRRGGPNYQEGLRYMQESVESMVLLTLALWASWRYD